MNFVPTEQREHVALSNVVSYATMMSGKIRLIDRSGESHLVNDDDWETALAGAFQAIIPAQPGTFFLTPVSHPDGSTTYDQDQVIAWGVTYRAYTVAIGTQGPDDMNRAILMPNGAVTEAGGDWNSLEDYLRSVA